MNKKIIHISVLSFILTVIMSYTASAMPSYDKAPDAAAWGGDNDTFTSAEYLQTSQLKANRVGYRGESRFQGGLYSSLRLPKEDVLGRAISWESSDPEIVADNGTLLKRPEKTKTVTMTATAAPLPGEDESYSKSFSYTVHADYVVLDDGPAAGNMLIDENFYDGEYDTDIFEVTTSAGGKSEVRDGALVITKTDNSYHGNKFKIWHTKDHTPITSGIYAEEFTWDKQNNSKLGFWQEIGFYQANIDKNTGETVGEPNIGSMLLARGDAGVGDGGKIRIYQNTLKYGSFNFWPLNWASNYRPNYVYETDDNGNQKSDNGRLPNNKSMKVKFIYNYDEGNYQVYIDGNLVTVSGKNKFDFLPQTGKEVDPDTLQVETYAPNGYYTQIIFDGNVPEEGVTDYMSISDYKFYEVTDKIAVQFSTPKAPYVSAWNNISTANVFFSRVSDETKIGDITLKTGDKLKFVVAAYNGDGGLTASTVYDVTVPGVGINISSFNPYYSEEIRNADKSKVKGFLWKDGTLIPVCESKYVEY